MSAAQVQNNTNIKCPPAKIYRNKFRPGRSVVNIETTTAAATISTWCVMMAKGLTLKSTSFTKKSTAITNRGRLHNHNRVGHLYSSECPSTVSNVTTTTSGIGLAAAATMPCPWPRLALVALTCVLAFCVDVADSMKLPPINWNASNPMFKTSNNDHVIQVNMFDELDFICPQFSDSEEQESYEYYIIYQVSKREYDDCSIFPESRAIMIVNCSSPNQRKRFTLLFEPFASIPHVPEFRRGSSYYYITTSTGHRDGITNSQQGACYYRNMKLTITVCCSTTTTTPRPTTTPTPATTTTTTTRARPSTATSTTKITTKTSTTTRITNPRYPSGTTRPGKNKNQDTGNDINKLGDEDGVDHPKKEGLVNSAGGTAFCQPTLRWLLSGLFLCWTLTHWHWR